MKLILLLTLFITVSCASEKASQSKINSLEISEKLVKGETTQAQVIENFGAPDIVEKSPEGDMWAYTRYANENKSNGASISHYIAAAGLWNFTGVGLNTDKSTSSTNTASLVLYFTPSKKLRTYNYRTEKF
jgi:hypothetical protein